MCPRLFHLDGLLLWSEPSTAESHQIMAARGDRRVVIIPDLPAPPIGIVGVAGRVIWADPAGVHILADGEVTDLPETGVRCLAATPAAAYTSRPAGAQSAIAEVGGGTVAKLPGQVDRLLAIGDALVWTCAGGFEVFAQPIAGGAPSIVYGATEPFAICADGDRHLLIATGQGVVRIAIATGEIARLASDLAAGTPRVIAIHGDTAYIARGDRTVERVADGRGAIIHVATEPVTAMAATAAGVHVLEGHRLHFVAGTAAPVTRSRTPTASPVAIELAADGSLKATFVAALDSCTDLVRRIASEAPRRLDLVCDRASPGDAFASACRGRTLASVRALVCDVPWRETSDGDVGAFADLCSAMPGLERAFVRGRLDVEPLEHATLHELHLISNALQPTLAKALAASQLPRLERCALRFPKISTASLLGLVRALAQLRAPALHALHLGALRGPDQIRDVVAELAQRGAPPTWKTLAFTGALGGEESLADVLEAVMPPPGLSIALPLDAYGRDFIDNLQRRKKWLVDLDATELLPCDPRAYAAW